MKGEDIMNDTCWIIKSHFPWIMPFAPRFQVNKVIMIVRNPTESCCSRMHLTQLGNHSTKIPFDVQKLYPNYWKWWVQHNISMMRDFYQRYIDDSSRQKVPILYVRFEDLVTNPEPELMKIMRFLLNEKDLTGSNAQRRIKDVLALGKSATVTYSLKDTTTKFDASRSLYSAEQQAWIKEEMKDMMHFFGYAKLPQDPENPTGFVEYDGQDETLLRKYKAYEKQNEDMINLISTMTDEELDEFVYELNDPETEVPLANFDIIEKSLIPVYHHFEKKFYGRTFDQCD